MCVYLSVVCSRFRVRCGARLPGGAFLVRGRGFSLTRQVIFFWWLLVRRSAFPGIGFSCRRCRWLCAVWLHFIVFFLSHFFLFSSCFSLGSMLYCIRWGCYYVSGSSVCSVGFTHSFFSFFFTSFGLSRPVRVALLILLVFPLVACSLSLYAVFFTFWGFI